VQDRKLSRFAWYFSPSGAHLSCAICIPSSDAYGLGKNNRHASWWEDEARATPLLTLPSVSFIKRISVITGSLVLQKSRFQLPLVSRVTHSILRNTDDTESVWVSNVWREIISHLTHKRCNIIVLQEVKCYNAASQNAKKISETMLTDPDTKWELWIHNFPSWNRWFHLCPQYPSPYVIELILVTSLWS